MAFCRNCGAEIDDKAVLCVHCGVPISPAATLLIPRSVFVGDIVASAGWALIGIVFLIAAFAVQSERPNDLQRIFASQEAQSRDMIASLFAVTSVLGFVLAGAVSVILGLWGQKKWAHIVAIVASFFSSIVLCFAIIVGVYSLLRLAGRVGPRPT